MRRQLVHAGVCVLVVAAAFSCARGSEEVSDIGSSTPPDGGASVTVNDDSGSSGGPAGGDGGGDPGPDPTACDGKIVINELMANGPSNSEFVELYNPSSCVVQLDGWKILYRSGSNNTGAGGAELGPGDSIAGQAFFVIATSSFSGSKDATLMAGFGNSGGQVGLLDDKGKLVDAVGYASGTKGDYTEGSPAANPPTNGSIARKVDGVDTDDNQADFKTSQPHTAGAPN